jgi:hypothetical protein
MNERIKLLIEQAQDWADAHAPYASEEQEYFAEKFAELIVLECANVADENYIHRGSRTCGLAIRLHFGVEE